MRRRAGRAGRAIRVAIAAILLVVATAVNLVGMPPRSAQAVGTSVYLIGDSLTWYGGGATAVALENVGWATNVVDAHPNRRLTFHSESDSYDGLDAVDYIRASHGDSQYWIVDLGTNDVWVEPDEDHVAVIRRMLDRIGADRQVLWVNVHLPGFRELEHNWNAALATVDAESGQMTVFDWASLADQHPEWMSFDNVHHTAEGMTARAAAIAEASLQMLAPATNSGGLGPTAIPIGAPGGLVPIGPLRILDTRANGFVVGGSVTRVPLSAVVPAGTTAVAINLTAVGSVGGGFATAFPCGSAVPPSSTVNFAKSDGTPQSSAAIVSVDEHAALCVFANVATHLVVDVSGAFVPGGGIGMAAVAPQRLLDTRTNGSTARGVLAAGTTTRVHTSVVNGAVLVNVTADRVGGNGYLTAWPCAQARRPTVSNLNVTTKDDPRANASLVPIGADGNLCIYNQAPTAIIVDLLGVFAAGHPLRFQSAIPIRMLDTRPGIGGWSGRLAPGQTIDVALGGVPAGAIAVGTVTVTGVAGAGYLTAWDGATGLPATSNLNYGEADVRPNLFAAATAATPNGTAIALTAGAAGRPHVIIDLTGWFVLAG